MMNNTSPYPPSLCPLHHEKARRGLGSTLHTHEPPLSMGVYYPRRNKYGAHYTPLFPYPLAVVVEYSAPTRYVQ